MVMNDSAVKRTSQLFRGGIEVGLIPSSVQLIGILMLPTGFLTYLGLLVILPLAWLSSLLVAYGLILPCVFFRRMRPLSKGALIGLSPECLLSLLGYLLVLLPLHNTDNLVKIGLGLLVQAVPLIIALVVLLGKRDSSQSKTRGADLWPDR